MPKKCRYPFPSVEATFADGHKQRLSIWSQEGRPFDWARAAAVHTLAAMSERQSLKDRFTFYPRADHGPIVAMVEHRTGEVWDPLAIAPKRRAVVTAAQLRQVLKGVLAGDQAAIERATELLQVAA